MEIAARLARPGLVVLADQFYPGWQAEVEGDGGPPRPVPILQTNRVMRGLWLPAGSHRLTFRYRPWSFAWAGHQRFGLGGDDRAGCGVPGGRVFWRRLGGMPEEGV